MSIFRSETMLYYEFRMPRETAWQILNEIGDIDCVQFVDQNADKAAFSRPFSSQIDRCRKVEDKLLKIEEFMNRFKRKEDRPIKKCPDVTEYLRNLRQFLQIRQKSESSYFDEIEQEVNEQEEQITKQIENYDQLLNQFQYFESYQQVMEAFQNLLSSNDQFKRQTLIDEEMGSVGQGNDNQNMNLNYVSGVIKQVDQERFQRFVYRITKGNSYINIQNCHYGEDLQKLLPGHESEENMENNNRVVFLIVYTGGKNNVIQNKLIKLCDSFNAQRYQIPQKEQVQDKQTEITKKIRDLKLTLQTTKANIEEKVLDKFQQTRFEKNDCSLIEELKLLLAKEKAIYTNMNLLSINDNVFYGYAWVAQQLENKVQNCVANLNRSKKSQIIGCEISKLDKFPHNMTAPTFFRTNNFTAPFQEIVDTYGIPRYREINPGLFTIGMFPFLFGVMFGDIGHGGLLLIFGIYINLNYEKLKNVAELKEIMELRFLIFMMGFFATYCGLIYNDFFSIPFNLFGTCWETDHHTGLQVMTEGCIYPFGLDPKWYIARNELNFFNSYKMKLAVIIGVAQMFFGILLKGANALHFRLPLDFLFEFIPQVIFMSCTFIFMDAMIFIKWSTDWSADTSVAPSIITQMINLALAGGSVDNKPLWDADSQVAMNQAFMIIAGIMVPMMLVPKIFFLWLASNKKSTTVSHADKKEYLKLDNQQPLVEKDEEEHEDHDHDISEVFVHQMIETIEFVLGSISNTASYLRLWALSLAHSQLAKTFFTKCIGAGITSGSIIGIFIGWTLFVCVTFGVLMCMDVMECLLHALRLQWVEFQNKFFKADGHKFKPFSFKLALEEVNNK